MNVDRKPLAVAQSKVVKSLRVDPAVWDRIELAARHRATDASALSRDLWLIGLTVIENAQVREAYMRALAVIQTAALPASA